MPQENHTLDLDKSPFLTDLICCKLIAITLIEAEELWRYSIKFDTVFDDLMLGKGREFLLELWKSCQSSLPWEWFSERTICFKWCFSHKFSGLILAFVTFLVTHTGARLENRLWKLDYIPGFCAYQHCKVENFAYIFSSPKQGTKQYLNARMTFYWHLHMVAFSSHNIYPYKLTYLHGLY